MSDVTKDLAELDAVELGRPEESGICMNERQQQPEVPCPPGSGPTPNRSVVDRPTLKVVRLEDVEPEPVEWIWPGRLVAGNLNVIAGYPGLGKSTLSCDIAARVSAGLDWPNHEGRATPGDVLIVNVEDSLPHTVVPRLRAAGADMSRIAAVDGLFLPGQEEATDFDISVGIEALKNYLAEIPTLSLIVLDPISALLGHRVDSHNEVSVRRALRPLAGLAVQWDVGIVAIAHLNKNTAQDAISRVGGSGAFTAAPRAVYAVADLCGNDDGQEQRLFGPLKANLAPPQPSLTYAIDQARWDRKGQTIEASRIVWQGTSEVSVRDAMSFGRGSTDQGSEVEDAAALIQELLKEGGEMAIAKYNEAVKDFQVPRPAVKEAEKRLRVEKKAKVFGGPWFVSIPEEGEASTESGESPRVPGETDETGETGGKGS